MSFREIVDKHGHRRIIELLTRSVSRGTLPPSLVFAGPAGSGKRATALSLAQALNCLSPAGGDCCGKCAQCTRIARGVHPDVLVVEPGDSGSIKIDQVRDIVERSAYKPFEGRRRAVIIDQADQLVPAAQNALLKILEEPPASSVFALLTARPDMLLPTVRSRCVTLAFASGERPAIDEDARAVAQRVLVQTAGSGGAAVSEARRLDAAKELLTNTGGGSAADRQQVAAHLTAMASLVRDLAAIGARADDEVLAHRDIRPALERLAPAYQGERGVAAYAAIASALDAVERNVGIKIVADWLVLQL